MVERDKELLSSCGKQPAPVTCLQGNQRTLSAVGAPYTMVGWYTGLPGG